MFLTAVFVWDLMALLRVIPPLAAAGSCKLVCHPSLSLLARGGVLNRLPLKLGNLK